jgi:putative resolvase
VVRVLTEVGPAPNGRRREFPGFLRDPAATVIAAGRRDRFARFGAECAKAALPAQGRRLLAADPCELDRGFVRDAAEILTSMCGRCAAGSRAARAVAALGRGGAG